MYGSFHINNNVHIVYTAIYLSSEVVVGEEAEKEKRERMKKMNK